jgi:hypothetical protein
MNWILPLFPAEPKLGPVYYPVSHFVPSNFPFLMVLPAAAIDLFLDRARNWPRWRLGLAAGAVFVTVLLAVEWPFGDFLMSSWSRNWFFHTHMYDYATRPTSYLVRNLFFPFERSAASFSVSLAIGVAVAMLEGWGGLIWGAWLSRVKR